MSWYWWVLLGAGLAAYLWSWHFAIRGMAWETGKKAPTAGTFIGWMIPCLMLAPFCGVLFLCIWIKDHSNIDGKITSKFRKVFPQLPEAYR